MIARGLTITAFALSADDAWLPEVRSPYWPHSWQAFGEPDSPVSALAALLPPVSVGIAVF